MIDLYTKQKKYRGYDIIIKIKFYDSLESPTFGWWFCGYVRLPERHVFYGATFDDYPDINRRLKVRGLVNFFGCLDGFDGYYLGFGCNHGGDDTRAQDEEYTTRECEQMVDRLIEVGRLEVAKI